MTFQEQPTPALLLFHEKGDLLFVNPGTTELTGFSALELRRLEDCLGRLFPGEGDLAMISGVIHQAFARAEGSEPLQFVAEFTTRAGNRRRGTFQVNIWREGFAGRRLLLCLQPAPALALPPEAPAHDATQTEVTDQIEELLDDAIGCILTIQREGCSRDRLDSLVRKIARSRCLLGGTTGFDRVWSARNGRPEKPAIPPRIKVSETKVDS